MGNPLPSPLCRKNPPNNTITIKNALELFQELIKQSSFDFFLFQVFDVYCHSNVSPSSLHSEVPSENVQCCKISMLVFRLYKLLLEAGK